MKDTRDAVITALAPRVTQAGVHLKQYDQEQLGGHVTLVDETFEAGAAGISATSR